MCGLSPQGRAAQQRGALISIMTQTTVIKATTAFNKTSLQQLDCDDGSSDAEQQRSHESQLSVRTCDPDRKHEHSRSAPPSIPKNTNNTATLEPGKQTQTARNEQHKHKTKTKNQHFSIYPHK